MVIWDFKRSLVWIVESKRIYLNTHTNTHAPLSFDAGMKKRLTRDTQQKMILCA